MNKLATKILSILTILIIMVLIITALIFGKTNRPGGAHDIKHIDKATISINGLSRDVTLPFKIKNQDSGTKISVSFLVMPEDDNVLCVKSNYAPFDVSIENNVLVSYSENNCPFYMIDPPTSLFNVVIPESEEPLKVTINYSFPKTRSTLTINAPMLSNSAGILTYHTKKYVGTIIFAIILMSVAFFMIVIYFSLRKVSEETKIILWLGLFNLSVGLWLVGENDFSLFLVHNPVIIYLFTFTGLFTMIIFLTLFVRRLVRFKNSKICTYIVTIMLIADFLALALQLTGIFMLSSAARIIDILTILSLSFLTGQIFYEGFFDGNKNAAKLFPPIAVLFTASVAEVINYVFSLTIKNTILFQIGIFIFMVFITITGIQFISEIFSLKQNEKELEFEVKLMKMQISQREKEQLKQLKMQEHFNNERHDLRHKLEILKNYGEKQDFEKLCEYIDSMTENLNDCFDTRYCSNDAVNAVVCQYASIAEKNGINLTISLDVPTHSEKISDIDLCVIFGNLLENAIEACNAMEKGEKFIKLISNHHLSKLIITMDNSFNGVFIKKNGVIISSKDDSVGLGVSSVETLAKGHGGSSHFEPDKHSDIFHSSVYFEI